MANVLEQYGIKEVADVTIYKIERNEAGLTTYKPVLFLDTLKVSTIEQTAEQAEARGGKGNPPLIIWDYGKEITVTLEDALFSPASMALMFGDKDGVDTTLTQVTKMEKVVLTTTPTAIPTGVTWYAAGTNGTEMTVLTSENISSLGNGSIVYEEKTVAVQSANKIVINATTWPGTYKLVGETWARNRATGEDEFFQFVIPQAKMGSENTITLEAEGDPSVFNMTMRVLRPDDGNMMELIQYSVPDAQAFSAQTFSAPVAKKTGSLS